MVRLDFQEFMFQSDKIKNEFKSLSQVKLKINFGTFSV